MLTVTQKIIARAGIALVTLFLLTPVLSMQAYAAETAFPDVPQSSTHFTAIQTLKERNIVSGFPDGLFRPEQVVTRAEILKIALEGAGITTESYVASAPAFTDVTQTHSLLRYINYASSNHIVDGYGDGRYGPDNPVTRGEAPKILLRLNGLSPASVSTAPFDDTPISLDLTAYIAYVTEKNLAEVHGSRFGINDGMTRGDVAEMMYRLLYIREKSLDRYPEETEQNVSAIDGVIAPEFYDGIILDHALSQTIIEGEVITVAGRVTAGSQSIVTAFVMPENEGKQEFFHGSVIDGVFELSIPFTRTGLYRLGVIPGMNGSSHIASLAVVPDPKLQSSLPSYGAEASALSVGITDTNETVFRWETAGARLSKLTIRQGGRSVEHVFGYGTNHWSARFKEFALFSEGSITWSVALANASDDSPYTRSTQWSVPTEQNRQITQHHFSFTDTDRIRLDHAPISFTEPRNINYRATALAPLSSDVYIITPQEKIIILSASSDETIGQNQTINVPLELTANGAYIIEINATDNLAVVNSPIYIGTDIPLLPDLHDIEEGTEPTKLAPLTNSETETLRTTLLNRINSARVRAGLTTVVSDTQLDGLAQAHTDDMITNDYFSHVSLDGKSPEDRARERNILVPVGENIARTDSIEGADFGLFRSAIHRKNILTAQWLRVGIGLGVDSTGNLVVTEEFSVRSLSRKPLTESEKNIIREELLAAIDRERERADLDPLTHNTDREERLQEWLDEHPNGDLQDALPHIKDGRAASLWSVSSFYYPTMIQEIIDSQPAIIREQRWEEISIGIIEENERAKIVTAFVQ